MTFKELIALKIKSMVENNLSLSNMINKTIEGLKSEFNILENPMDKYQYIIDIGKEKGETNHDIRSEANLTKGCVSQSGCI